MKETEKHNERMAKITFSSVYPYYVKKVQSKGRTEEELLKVIEWLTGFRQNEVEQLLNDAVSFEIFFEKANLNPLASQVKGVICGYRVEEIENPLTKKIRILDKLIDELAKGRAMSKILRQ